MLASHAAPLVRKMYAIAVLMEHGRVLRVGKTDEVLDYYENRSKDL